MAERWLELVERVADAGMRRYRLSPRQRQVIWLVMAGRTNAEIADALCLSDRTVKNVVSLTAQRLGVDNAQGGVRAEIVARLLRIEGVAERGLREYADWADQTGANAWQG